MCDFPETVVTQVTACWHSTVVHLRGSPPFLSHNSINSMAPHPVLYSPQEHFKLTRFTATRCDTLLGRGQLHPILAVAAGPGGSFWDGAPASKDISSQQLCCNLLEELISPLILKSCLPPTSTSAQQQQHQHLQLQLQGQLQPQPPQPGEHQPPLWFSNPPQILKGGSPQSLCVTISPGKVRSTPGAYNHERGYTKIVVGTNEEGGKVEITAHHLVCWLAHGLHFSYTSPQHHSRGDPYVVSQHLCHNKSCVNPSHLEWGTVGENLRSSLRFKAEKRLSPTPLELKNSLGMVIARRKYERM